MIRNAVVAVATLVVTAVLPSASSAQLFTLTREQLVELSAQNPFERFPDGRPKVPDALIERARGLSAEEVLAVLPGKGFRNQYAGRLPDPASGHEAGRPRLHRAVHAAASRRRGRAERRTPQGRASRGYQQPVRDRPCCSRATCCVVDLFGKKEGGTIVGDNLFYYVMKATKGGRPRRGRLDPRPRGLSRIPMPAYFRHAHPTPIGNVMLTGINVPVRIGERHRDARRPRLRRPRGRLLHPAGARARRCSTRPTRRTSTTSGRRRSSTRASTSRARSTARRRTRRSRRNTRTYLKKRLEELRQQ